MGKRRGMRYIGTNMTVPSQVCAQGDGHAPDCSQYAPLRLHDSYPSRGLPMHLNLCPIALLRNNSVAGNGQVRDGGSHVSHAMWNVQGNPGRIVYEYLLGSIVEVNALRPIHGYVRRLEVVI